MANTVGMPKRKAKMASGSPARAGRALRPQNRKLLRWLDSWLATPDDRGENWWSEFEADLMRNPVTLRFPRTG